MDKLVDILNTLGDFILNGMPKPMSYTLESFNEYNREKTVMDLCASYTFSSHGYRPGV